MTKSELEILCKEIARAVRLYVDKELPALTKRIDALEQRPQLRYAGVYKTHKVYPESSFVTHAGGLWLALSETKTRPGQSGDWQLVVKSGGAQ